MKFELSEGKERCLILGEYIANTGATVRKTASEYGISKSTVHKDVTVTLKSVNRGLWSEVGMILAKNKSERHLRGGEATKRKYLTKQN